MWHFQFTVETKHFSLINFDFCIKNVWIYEAEKIKEIARIIYLSR